MARKPIEVERVGLLTPRERIWQGIRKLRAGFTAQELQEAIDKPILELDVFQDYLQGLEAAGHIQRLNAQVRTNNRFGHVRFKLLKDNFEAPRTTVDGKTVQQGIKTLAMWRAMKALREFDWHEVQRAASLGKTCEITPQTAKTYVTLLARAGYFKEMRVAQPGRPARYRLTRDTGAHAPAITRRKAVFDRNNGEFTWQQPAQEVCDGLN